jgi:hypothetical protein
MLFWGLCAGMIRRLSVLAMHFAMLVLLFGFLEYFRRSETASGWQMSNVANHRPGFIIA